MTSYRDALDAILALPMALGTERIALREAAGRFLAEPVRATYPLPRYSQSSMDGIATSTAWARGGEPLRIAGESAAGHPWLNALAPGEAVRISTGAAMPEGADVVVPRELLRTAEDGLVTPSQVGAPGHFVRHRGEDIAEGSVIAAAGTRLSPAMLAFVAASGIMEVAAYRRPRVAILTSGDELRMPGEALGPHDTVAASLLYLEHELRACGCDPRVLGIARDTEEDCARLLGEARAFADIIVTTAGVSVGDHDAMGRVLRAAGASPLFWRVAVRPGKPMLVARLGAAVVFGLPGNPVATACNTEIFVKPFLRRWLGVEPPVLPHGRARLARELAPDRERLFFVYAQSFRRDPGLAPGEVAALPRQSSANLANPAKADCLIVVPPGDTPLAAGAEVAVLPVREGL